MIILGAPVYIEYTMIVSFDIRFIRRDQKQRRNGEACRAIPTFFWTSLINFISKGTYVFFYLPCIICGFNGERTVKQMKRDAGLLEFADVANVL